MSTIIPVRVKYFPAHKPGILLLVISFLFLFPSVYGQIGYIYLHKKALDESSGIDFTFNITGDTVISGITLNDKSDYLNIGDIGSGHGISAGNSGDGQLWASTVAAPGIPSYSQEGLVYMRPSGSSLWVSTGQTGYRLDGAGYNNMVYINKAGAAYFYTYGGTASQIYYPANHANIKLRDIAFGDGLTVITNDSGHIMKYTGSYAHGDDSWVDLTVISGIPAFALGIDIVPSTQKIVVQQTLNMIVPQGTIYTMNNDGSGLTIVPYPANTGPAYAHGICVDDLGRIYSSYYDNGLQADFLYDYDGVDWTINQQARYCGRPTGGINGEVWAVNLNDAATTAATLFTLVPDGNRNWIDDERIHPPYTGNSIMIPVKAGSYTITQNPSMGWDLNEIVLYDPTLNSAANTATKTATLDISADEIVHVTFTNELVQVTALLNNCGMEVLEDFSSGTPAFASPVVGITPYHYVADGFPLDGYYTIAKTGTAWPISNSIANDHTADGIDGGNGYFMLVNASYGTDEFYRKRVSGLIPGESYTLSFWAANISPSLPVIPNITFGFANVNTGNFIGSVNTGNITSADWSQHIFTFNATTATADMVIRNNGIGGKGNDLVIDDISLSHNCLLPFKLLSFTAVRKNNHIQLDWQTSAENGITAYEVEKSADCIHFVPAGTLAANAGSSINDYSYIDNNSSAAATCYRLRITEKSGAVTYSTIKVVAKLAADKENILLYPNPARAVVQVIFPQTTSTQSWLNIYNQEGRMIQTIPAGNRKMMSIDTENLPKSVYYIRLVNGRKVLYTTKLVKI